MTPDQQLYATLRKDDEPAKDIAPTKEIPIRTHEITDWLTKPENAEKYGEKVAAGFLSLGNITQRYERALEEPEKYENTLNPNRARERSYNPFGMLLSQQVNIISDALRRSTGRYSDDWSTDVKTNATELKRYLPNASQARWLPIVAPELLEKTFGLTSGPNQDMASKLWYELISDRPDISMNLDEPSPASATQDGAFEILVAKFRASRPVDAQESKDHGGDGNTVVRFRGGMISAEMVGAMRDWVMEEPSKALNALSSLK